MPDEFVHICERFIVFKVAPFCCADKGYSTIGRNWGINGSGRSWLMVFRMPEKENAYL